MGQFAMRSTSVSIAIPGCKFQRERHPLCLDGAHVVAKLTGPFVPCSHCTSHSKPGIQQAPYTQCTT